jgi:hypothetical protein
MAIFQASESGGVPIAQTVLVPPWIKALVTPASRSVSAAISTP